MGAKKRVVVTGGSGGIGSQVVLELARRGHDVVNVDRKGPRDAPKNVRFVYADLRERHQFQPSFENADVVCHLGEIPNPVGYLSKNELFATNITVGSAVLQTAADLEIPRVIYTSSAQVYGHWGGDYKALVPTRLPMDETEPLRPENQYALSKVANESYAAFVARTSKTSVSIFRPPWVMTQEQAAPRWLRWLEMNRNHDEGFSTFIYIDDLVDAYVKVVEHDHLPGGCEAYHFVADEVRSLLPLKERMSFYAPGCPQLPSDWPEYKSPVSCEKARRDFGWTPRFNIRHHFQQVFGREPVLKAEM